MSKENEDFNVKQGSEQTPEMNRFDRLMFGPRIRKEENKTSKDSKSEGMDFNHLMGQIDDIMTSIEKIKPAINDISPLLNFFKKK